VILNEVFKDKIIFLKPVGKTYQSVGKTYFKPQTSDVRYHKHTYHVPKEPSSLNKYGKRSYYIDYKSGKQITFDTAKHTPPLTTKEMDLLLKCGIIENLIISLKTTVAKDWVMLLLAFGCGFGIGALVGMALLGVFG